MQECKRNTQVNAFVVLDKSHRLNILYGWIWDKYNFLYYGFILFSSQSSIRLVALSGKGYEIDLFCFHSTRQYHRLYRLKAAHEIFIPLVYIKIASPGRGLYEMDMSLFHRIRVRFCVIYAILAVL